MPKLLIRRIAPFIIVGLIAVPSLTAFPQTHPCSSIQRSTFDEEALATMANWVMAPYQRVSASKNRQSAEVLAANNGKQSLEDPIRKAVREQIFVQNDGIDFATTVDILDRHRIIELLRRPGSVTFEEVHAMAGGNAGYLRVALRLLEDQGWVTHQNYGLFASRTRYRLTPQGEIATRPAIMSAYSKMSELIYFRLSTIAEIDNFLATAQPRGPPLSYWVDLARDQFHLQAEEPGSEADDIRTHILTQLQGVLNGPLFISLRDKGVLKPWLSTNTPLTFEVIQHFSNVPLHDQDLRSALDFLELMGWVEKSGEAGFSFTASGRVWANLAGKSYGVPVSYLPMLSQVETLLFGDPSEVFARDEFEQERHVHRDLNVRGSGAAHEKYFEEVREKVKEIFDQPIDRQPQFIADMGSGDGTFLAVMYDYILKNTLRGELIAQDPKKYKLWIIGADFNKISRENTWKTLEKAKIPYFRTVPGDINDPKGLARTIRKLDLGLDTRKGLHTNTFLIHNRPFISPSALWKLLNFWRRSEISGAYVSPDSTFAAGGYTIANRLVERNLYEFLKRWKPYIAEFGMLAIELHLMPPEIAAENNRGRVMATSYDATHLYSGQYIVEVPIYLAQALKAGLSAAWQIVKPVALPNGHGAISFTHFLVDPPRASRFRSRRILATDA